MIKVSVLCPNGDGKTFDMDYYCNKHLPMVAEALGSALKLGAVEKGLAGGAPDAPATYLAMGHLYFDTVESFLNAFGPHIEKFQNDISNFTNARTGDSNKRSNILALFPA